MQIFTTVSALVRLTAVSLFLGFLVGAVLFGTDPSFSGAGLIEAGTHV
ncbi:hypothetical protein [Kineosporia babensis]|uniref:Uncharacterized protein n=1 Tax=Kineosporia babensis TaxID=499548 RepID=A0A9X1N9P4_9ACTN|nr:hypothetical protein [Kineosporia babensis]MCD5310957.1 hypothetical protein [Kineosporia babensis]